MSGKELYEAIGKIDDDILEESETAKKKTGNWLKWGAAAACLGVLIAGAVIWRGHSPSHSGTARPAVSDEGVTIPPLDVSLSANSQEEASMEAFFIYQGRCYVRYASYDDAEIIGEYLGTATGLIDEWTPKEGYVEFAGSVEGDFYAVKGYDPAFMLCMKGPDGAVSAFICDNGITLEYGSELYEDRLHLSGNIESVEYESRASWYFSRGERYRMSGVDQAVLDLIAEMDSARFVPSDSVPLKEGADSVADTELYHLYFQMKDGTTVHLRLHENGYVCFDGILPVCVQVSDETYLKMLDLLDNNANSVRI